MRVIDWTSKAASFLGGVATFVIMALVAFDVLMRYFLNEPQLFVDEVVSFLQVLVVFWGLAHTFRGGGHIRVDLVTAYLLAHPPAHPSLRFAGSELARFLDADPGAAFVPESDTRTYNGSVWLLARSSVACAVVQ